MHTSSELTNRSRHSIDRRPCSKCDGHMLITRIEPDTPGRRLLTFECSKCGYETVLRTTP
jgi:DNA-directed RNA polymerase subunit M/transcription elongation factor TFIIS